MQQPGHVTVLNNERLPVDTRGNPLLTGEASVLWSPDELAWYAYFNNWGSCGDVNCCNATFGCACCCFRVLQGDCVYADGHVVVVYRTTDFATWEVRCVEPANCVATPHSSRLPLSPPPSQQYLGEALPLANRKPGIVFRPTVVYNAATKMYIMWYEDRWTGQTGYAVATSRRPEGPFETIADTVNMTTPYKIGDFDIMVDTDGVAYHVRTGLVVEELNADYTGVTGQCVLTALFAQYLWCLTHCKMPAPLYHPPGSTTLRHHNHQRDPPCSSAEARTTSWQAPTAVPALEAPRCMCTPAQARWGRTPFEEKWPPT